MTKEPRAVADPEALTSGIEAAVRAALSEGNLGRCVGESGTIQLGVSLRLDRGRVVWVDAGLGFQRRVF